MKKGLLTVLFFIVFSTPSIAGIREVSFIYKPKFVTADYILKYIQENRKEIEFLPRGKKLNSENNQDFILFGFMGSVKRFNPPQRKAINYLIKNVDIPYNAIKLLGFSNVREFQIKYNLKPDNIIGVKTKTKLLEILGKDKPVRNRYALSSNELSVFDQTHLEKTKEIKIKNYSFIFRNYLFKEYLGLENAGSGVGFEEKTIFFEGPSNIGYLESICHDKPINLMIWTTPKNWHGKILNEYSDVLVLPKYLGSNDQLHLFALVDAPTIEQKEKIYSKIKTIFLQDRKTAINKIVEDMSSVWKENKQIITNNSIGEFYIGQDINEIIKIYGNKYQIIKTRKNKGNYETPVILVYPKDDKTHYRPDILIEAEYKDDKIFCPITCIYTENPKYTTKEGIRIYSEGIDLMSIEKDYQIVTTDHRTFKPLYNAKNKFFNIKIPQYNNITFLFGDWRQEGVEKIELAQIIVGTPE